MSERDRERERGEREKKGEREKRKGRERELFKSVFSLVPREKG